MGIVCADENFRLGIESGGFAQEMNTAAKLFQEKLKKGDEWCSAKDKDRFTTSTKEFEEALTDDMRLIVRSAATLSTMAQEAKKNGKSSAVDKKHANTIMKFLGVKPLADAVKKACDLLEQAARKEETPSP